MENNIKIVNKIEDIKINGITSKFQSNENIGTENASYRFFLISITQSILDCFYDVARHGGDDEDCNLSNEELLNKWCNGVLPTLEMMVEFGQENGNIDEIQIVYFFENYECIYDFNDEEICAIKQEILDFIDKYALRVPNFITFDGGDAEFWDAIPQEIKDIWATIS